MNIYVSNLSFDVQNGDLKDCFSPYGEVASAKIVTDKFSGKSRGFGFVEMPDNAAANTAITALDSGMMNGRQIRVAVARPKESKPGGYSSSFGNKGRESYNNSRW